jgi:SAM-dependent methyltransferase
MRLETLHYLDVLQNEYELEIIEKDQQSGHIMTGLIHMHNTVYPIIHGVLVLLDNRFEIYKEFFSRLQRKVPVEAKKNTDSSYSSVESFGWQWQKWSSPYDEQLLEEVTLGYTNIDPSKCVDLPKKAKIYDLNKDENITLPKCSMIDAGCGHGLITEFFSDRCKYIIGLELSDACFVAMKRCHDKENIDIIQCDITDLSLLRKKSFDFVYSFGVLHHTIDIQKSFNNIAALVKNGGKLSVGVYYMEKSFKASLIKKYEMFIRAFISKLSNNNRFLYCELFCKYIRKPLIVAILKKMRFFYDPGGDLNYVSNWNYDFFGGHFYQRYLTHDECLQMWNNSPVIFSIIKRKFGNFINAYVEC